MISSEFISRVLQQNINFYSSGLTQYKMHLNWDIIYHLSFGGENKIEQFKGRKTNVETMQGVHVHLSIEY